MSTNIQTVRRACVLVALIAAGVPGEAAAQGVPKSATAAKQLTEVLDRLKLDAIAAPDPADPAAFVAALYFQGGQLLVVSAKYAAPSLLSAKLANKEYRDIYIDLNAASVAGSKLFVMDQSCDGLVARPSGSQAADTWEQGTTTTVFDGEWRNAKMSQEEYSRVFTGADERYANILTLLAAQAAKAGS